MEEPGTQLQRTEQATILLAAIQQLSQPKREVGELPFFEDQGGSEPFLTSILWRRPTDEAVTMRTSQTEKREGKKQRIEVIDGANRITLRVAPTAQITVRVMDGSKQLPHDWDWEYDCESLTIGAKILSWGACDEGMCITVSGPGGAQMAARRGRSYDSRCSEIMPEAFDGARS